MKYFLGFINSKIPYFFGPILVFPMSYHSWNAVLCESRKSILIKKNHVIIDIEDFFKSFFICLFQDMSQMCGVWSPVMLR